MQTRGWDNLPGFSQALYTQTYFIPGESYEGWLNRVCASYSNDEQHKQRLITSLRKRWWHPSTPPSSNAGTDRGLPISCYVQHVPDDINGIIDSWKESAHLGAKGGGVGKYWGDVREINASVGKYNGTTSGIIPFLGVDNNLTKGISQGGIRRASQAAYLPIWHPEIIEFMDIRNTTGDQSRRCHELHQGVIIDDKFMQAVIDNSNYDLISPKSNQAVGSINARDTWTKLMKMRVSVTGEPFLLFIDNANRQLPEAYVANNWKISTSQLCSEIFLHTEPNYTAVCCLASANAEYYDEWKHDEHFIADLNDFLDNILTDFIYQTANLPGFENARRSASNERSVALGVMGLHSLYQRKSVPFESPMAKGLNMQIFKHIRTKLDEHQANLPKSASCPLSKQHGIHRRNTTTMAIAPTMSISSLCGVTSSGIEPIITNAYTKKVKQGSFAIKNKYLDKIISQYFNDNGSELVVSYDGNWMEAQWQSIKEHNGSVQHLEWMDQNTKDEFKTAFEIDQSHIIDQAADRQQYIDQGQSVNLFIVGNSHVQRISDLHMMAWKRGLKSLYYLRSTAVNRGSTAKEERQSINTKQAEPDLLSDSCPSCG